MTNAFDQIKNGLEEAIDFAKGKSTKAKIHSFNEIDIKNLRKQFHMSQEIFASTLGISVGTLRHWERGDRTPCGPALVLLNIAQKAPETVLEALSK